ncbi:MAG: hypothetical protein GC165_19855 [Armatimonadetes bacterium]|nr:hypothetical protein [Armatimonadota bacterium]
MNIETFFGRFDKLANSVGSVENLRELVLHLAITGRLAEPEPEDGPVSELLTALSASANRHGKSRGPSIESVINSESIVDRPIATPTHWAWVPLNKIGLISGGMTPSKNIPSYWDGDVNWFSSKDIKADELNESELKITRKATGATRLNIYPPGCLVMVGRSGILKRTFPVSILRVEGTVNQDLKVLSPFVAGMERYLQVMLRSMKSFILKSLVKTGMTVQSLKYEEFEMQAFPLPPIGEQKRIVAKVDELMALCDQLEAQLREREAQQAELARASLARFAADPTPANLEFLFHQAFDIDPADLRKAILTLALQGKLVPQEPNDEPAFEILSRVSKHREQHAKVKAEKMTTRIHKLGKDQRFHQIPASWTWCRLGDIVLEFRYGTSRKCDRNSKGVPVLRIPNIQSGLVDATDLKFTDMPEAEFDSLRLREGDLLLVRSNGSESLVGRSAVVTSTDEKYAYAGYLVRARIPSEEVSAHFLQIALSTPAVRYQIEGPIRTTSGVKNINTSELSNIAFPLPPLAEQTRIVDKVGLLMALVDQLEAKQKESRAKAEDLLAALVHAITVPQSPSHVAESEQPDYQTFIHPSVFLAAEITDRLHDHNTFGQTKLQKVIYLAEYCLQLPEIESSYVRYQRGPYDPNLIDRIEAGLVEHQWFDVQSRSEGKGRQYSRLDGDERYHDLVRLQWQDKAKEIRDLVDMLRTWSSEDCEIFATLFAAWNDFIIHGEEVTDDKIINEVLYNWHEEKQRISKPTWQKKLDWMKAKGFIPVGYGKPTKKPDQPKLF